VHMILQLLVQQLWQSSSPIHVPRIERT
jgi:hypothetical protein